MTNYRCSFDAKSSICGSKAGCIPCSETLKQQKWLKSDAYVKVGDVVLFVKQESKLLSRYCYHLVIMKQDVLQQEQ